MMITETIKLRTADPARTNSAGETRSGATVVGTKMIETIKSASEVKKRILVVRPFNAATAPNVIRQANTPPTNRSTKFGTALVVSCRLKRIVATRRNRQAIIRSAA